jgi:hypothetical protein
VVWHTHRQATKDLARLERGASPITQTLRSDRVSLGLSAPPSHISYVNVPLQGRNGGRKEPGKGTTQPKETKLETLRSRRVFALFLAAARKKRRPSNTFFLHYKYKISQKQCLQYPARADLLAGRAAGRTAWSPVLNSASPKTITPPNQRRWGSGDPRPKKGWADRAYNSVRAMDGPLEVGRFLVADRKRNGDRY